MKKIIIGLLITTITLGFIGCFYIAWFIRDNKGTFRFNRGSEFRLDDIKFKVDKVESITSPTSDERTHVLREKGGLIIYLEVIAEPNDEYNVYIKEQALVVNGDKYIELGSNGKPVMGESAFTSSRKLLFYIPDYQKYKGDEKMELILKRDRSDIDFSQYIIDLGKWSGVTPYENEPDTLVSETGNGRYITSKELCGLNDDCWLVVYDLDKKSQTENILDEEVFTVKNIKASIPLKFNKIGETGDKWEVTYQDSNEVLLTADFEKGEFK